MELTGVAPLLPVPALTSAAVGAVAPPINITQRTFSANVTVKLAINVVHKKSVENE